jgi:hypothetical protein
MTALASCCWASVIRLEMVAVEEKRILPARGVVECLLQVLVPEELTVPTSTTSAMMAPPAGVSAVVTGVFIGAVKAELVARWQRSFMASSAGVRWLSRTHCWVM